MTKVGKKSGAGQIRTKEQRENDFNFITPLLLKGMNYRQIAKELAANRDYQITLVSVANDAKALCGQWHKEAMATLAKGKARELAKIDNLEQTYWAAWERSLQPQRKKTVKRGGDMTANPETGERRLLNPDYVREEEAIVQRVGDPRWLAGVERCIAARVKLLNLDKQAGALPGEGGDVSEYTAPEVRDITFTVRPRRDTEAHEEAHEIDEDADQQYLLEEGEG